ncbi:hypothetical protein GQ53DRAFT_763549 [Thozetella sp. PMI_491]|nr:hypothetical protein GQ53DRAFT_763549 [Thozetella sp. PMI_491]
MRRNGAAVRAPLGCALAGTALGTEWRGALHVSESRPPDAGLGILMPSIARRWNTPSGSIRRSRDSRLARPPASNGGRLSWLGHRDRELSLHVQTQSLRDYHVDSHATASRHDTIMMPSPSRGSGVRRLRLLRTGSDVRAAASGMRAKISSLFGGVRDQPVAVSAVLELSSHSREGVRRMPAIGEPRGLYAPLPLP